MSVCGDSLTAVNPKEPRVPVVDLPRVNAVQFQHYDHNVGAFLVTDDAAIARWIDEFVALPPGTVAADIETRGLDTEKFGITAVSASFRLGGDTMALLFDPLRREHHRKLLARLFDHAACIVFHNAAFDVAPLYAHRLLTRAHIRKIGDTLIAARMINTNGRAGRSLEDLATAYSVMSDDRTTMDEVFTARGLRKSDGYWFTDIDCPTYVVGALSDTVATLRLWGTPGVHGDGIIAAAARYLTNPDLGMGGWGALDAAAAEQVVEDAQEVNRIILERTARGYRVDNDFPGRFLAETEADTAAAARLLAEAGVRPGNGLDLVKALAANGEIDVDIWPKSPTGQLKADKKALEVFEGEDSTHNSPLVKAHKQVATSEKVLGYVSKVVENAGPTGRMHPEIKILGASATGRMCIPTTHRILTKRGVLKWDEVKPGDLTIDTHGRWTPVLEVHHYADQETVVMNGRNNIRLEATEEHRWVSSSESGGVPRLGPIDFTQRRNIYLAPLVSGFDIRGRSIDAETDGERLAAIVGVLVTDGRCTTDFTKGSRGDMRAFFYQTERKFYAEFMRIIPPEAVMYDRLLPAAKTRASVDAHEVRLKTRWLRPRLREFGLDSAPHLTANENLTTWVLGLTERECAAFLHAAYLGDGCSNTVYAQKMIAQRAAARDAIRIAAYRLGVRTGVRVYPPTGWGTEDQFNVIFHAKPTVGTRDLSISKGWCDVWCVTTAAGTFTAWDDGPYLTGNSASKPEIQQFPDAARGVIMADDEGWVSCDWKSIEPVVLATASGDALFLAEMRAGEDPYEPVGRLAGIDRKLAKRKMLADMYGQGAKAAALQYGWTVERAKEVSWKIREGLPILYQLIDALKRQSKNTGRIVTLSGRVLDQRIEFYEGGTKVTDIADRIAPNHFCQGSALDVMHHTILELDRRGLSDHVHLWMHDEVLADACIVDEVMDVMGTPPPFLQAIAAHHGIEPFLAVDRQEVGARWKSV